MKNMPSNRILLPLSLILACPGEQVVVRDVPNECGNGEIEADETCDDGNKVANDDRTDGCQIARCGDAITRLPQ